MLNQTSEKKAFGYHLMIDLYDCDPQKINSLDYCYKFLDELPAKIGMDKQSPPYIFRSPESYPGKAGLSGWVPLIQSGMSIHTLTETNFVSIDIYSCLAFDPNFVTAQVMEYFNSSKLEKKYVLRGEDYFIATNNT